MAVTVDAVKAVRKHFLDTVMDNEVIFKEMDARMAELEASVSARVLAFADSPYVAHKVGKAIDVNIKPVLKLRHVRSAIYPNAEHVTYYKVHIFPTVHQIHTDAKALNSALWTTIVGDELSLALLPTNADKEREAYYLLSGCHKYLEKIKARYSTLRSNIEWLTDNLDQLNKVESALRLEHNMKMTLSDVGDNPGESVGTDEGVDVLDGGLDNMGVEQGYDPLVDELASELEAEGEAA